MNARRCHLGLALSMVARVTHVLSVVLLIEMITDENVLVHFLFVVLAILINQSLPLKVAHCVFIHIKVHCNWDVSILNPNLKSIELRLLVTDLSK